MKKIKILLMILVSFCIAYNASAHFGMIIPSDSMVMQGDNRNLKLDISFSHPFEKLGMDMAKPDIFNLFTIDYEKKLLGSLKEVNIMNHKAWKAKYKIRRPGAHIFYMKPEPYFEPAEDCYIIHYTKTVVAAFGSDEGWDSEIGLKTEIVPLSKPFGLYAGNVFAGIVKLDGVPVSYAEVEVEYLNSDKKAEAPTDYMITQTIKADENGVFVYAAPKAGWWGFAALNTANYQLKYKGEKKDVEIGAVIWVKFHDWSDNWQK
jgi:cobalt/nickel transport protein